MKPTFNTKEEYLKWRTEWRARYSEISKDIHDIKLARRALASGLGRPRWASQRARIATIVKRFTDPQTGFFQSWCLGRLKDEARQMLEWRKESKVRAQEQYQKAHQAAPAAS